ncbi:MAG: hypothetical protein GQ558_00635 [Thermoplasmata archaeon]|nr:hypothetical protein [Thermoplasmata archaeon]
MPVHIAAVKCPSCGTAIEGMTGDRVFLCQCGVLHTRDDQGTRELHYIIASPRSPSAAPGSIVFIPFWRLDSQVTIHHQRSEGGLLHKIFGKDWRGGRMYIFVPAMDWDPDTYKHWASTLTKSPPPIHPATSFGPYERWAVTIEEGEAAALADFLILTFEAEKPGVLQDISFEVRVLGSSMIYFPFDRSSSALKPFF